MAALPLPHKRKFELACRESRSLGFLDQRTKCFKSQSTSAVQESSVNRTMRQMPLICCVA